MKIKIALCGAGGYGGKYLSALLDNEARGDYELVGIIDPFFKEKCNGAEVLQRGIRIYNDIEEFYLHDGADLVVISSPVQFHCEQIIAALKHGADVLCEKPLVLSQSQQLRIERTAAETGKFVAVGYQLAYSEAIQNLKADIDKGLFGKPIRFKTIQMNQRARSAPWMWKKYDGQGRAIFDSIAGNPGAHYIFNMFYVLANARASSLYPERLTAELYRASDIETCDSAFVKARAEDGTDFLYIGCTPVDDNKGYALRFDYAFEKANIFFDMQERDVKAVYKDGRVESYGDMFADEMKKLWDSVKAVSDRSYVLCDQTAAAAHLLFIGAMHRSMPDAIFFPQELIETDAAAGARFVRGLNDDAVLCYESYKLPSELGISWARPGGEILI